MKVTNIQAVNFKGRSFEHALAPVTLFYGPNFVGKSSRVEALVAALTGGLPGLSGKPGDQFRALSSGADMAVSAQLDGGLSVARRWSEKKGSVKHDAEIPAQFGREPFPAGAVDAGELLALSGPERLKALFRLATLPPELSVASLEAQFLAQVKQIKCDGADGVAVEAGIQGVVALIAGSHGQDKEPPATAQDWVAYWEEQLRVSRNMAVASVQRMEKTSQGLTQIGLSDAAPPPADAEQRLELARTGLTAALAEQERLRVAGQEQKRAYEVAVGKAAGAVDESKARERLRELEAEKERLFKSQADGFPASIDWSAQQEVFNALERSVADALDKGAELEAEKSLPKGVCPECGQPRKKRSAAAISKDIKAAKAELTDATKARDKAKVELDFAKVSANAITKRQNQFGADSEAFRRASQEHADLQAKLAANADSRAAAEQVAVLDAGREPFRLLWEAAVAAKNAAMDAGSKADVDYKRLVALRAEASSKAKADADRIKAQAEAAVLKQAHAMVQELTGKLVDAAIKPFLATANELCGGILKSPLTYVDGELYFERPSALGVSYVRVRRPSCSGTEEALAWCSISLAVASLSKAPVRLVVLDEVGRLDRENKFKLMARLCELANAGRIDNAVLIDVEPLECSAGKPGTFAEVEITV